jgi:hypothetical protein
MFTKATKSQSRLRLALTGPSGSGKTYSALKIACKLAELVGGRVAVIDSERGSASKYADEFDFDVCPLQDCQSPQEYTRIINEAAREGYAVLVIDSLSHAWAGREGALEQVDNADRRSTGGNKFAAWRDVTPHHNRLVDAILASPCHVIATMRARTEWILEEVTRKGRTVKVPRKVGLAPVMRSGIEYEFDVGGELGLDHTLMVSKTRCRALDGKNIELPGEELAKTLHAWVTDGVAPPAPAPASQPNPSPATETTPPASANASAPALTHYIVGKALRAWMTARGVTDIGETMAHFVTPTGVLNFNAATPEQLQKIMDALDAEALSAPASEDAETPAADTAKVR